jgi:hypothetical protein
MPKVDFESLWSIYQFLADADKLTWASVGVAVITGILYYRLFLPGPDNLSRIQPDYMQNPYYHVMNWRVMILCIISAGAGLLAYHQLPIWFPHAFLLR